MRFQFGKNWKNYLACVDENRIVNAVQSLQQMLNAQDLRNKSFLDIGSGSGLFSLAASRLGARVFSFDYDTNAVGCATQLKEKFASNAPDWKITQGSALDEAFLRSLGTFDVVYSWGVLHHTGNMWKALQNAATLVAANGQLFISIYNDQGGASRRWRGIKKLYNQSPGFIRWLLVAAVGLYFAIRFSLVRALKLQNPFPFKDWVKAQQTRGMSPWYDLVDWVGGYPFEVAKPDEIVNFYLERGFALEKLKTVGSGHGCNEYVFRRKKLNQA